MQKQPIGVRACIVIGYHCSECAWPIVHAVCADEFDTFKDAIDWDLWMYCSNKGCKNHEGQGFHFQWPTWCVKNSD
jgi:hypothetical protein